MNTHCPHGEHIGNHCPLCEAQAHKPTPASESVQEVGALDQAPGSAGKLKNEISLILLSVCRESEPRYRLDGYIRWGLVEREIHEAIDAAIRPTNQAEP